MTAKQGLWCQLAGNFATGLGTFMLAFNENFGMPRQLLLIAICIIAWGIFWTRIKQLVDAQFGDDVGAPENKARVHSTDFR